MYALLGRVMELFGADTPAGSAVPGPGVDGAAGSGWSGAAQADQQAAAAGLARRRGELGQADAAVDAFSRQLAADTAAGRRGAGQVLSSAQASGAVLAPWANTVPGRVALIASMGDHLSRAAQLMTSHAALVSQRSQHLATLAAAFHPGPVAGGMVDPRAGVYARRRGPGHSRRMGRVAFPGSGQAGGMASAGPGGGVAPARLRMSSGFAGGVRGFAPAGLRGGSPGVVPPAGAVDLSGLGGRPGKADEHGLQRYTILANRAISAAFPQINTIGGYRHDALKWHPEGLALDVMISSTYPPLSPQGIALGNGVLAYVLHNAKALGIAHAIWRQHMYYPDGTVESMEDRGGLTANHFDHVHIATIGGGYP